MNILFSVNRGYLIHLTDCIRSIVRFPAADGYDFYIMHTDLEESDKEKLRGFENSEIRMHYIYVDRKNDHRFPESDRYPAEIYYRIFASHFLPDTLDRILYLDADIVVINPLDTLYNMEFGGKYMLACTHTRKILNKFNQLRLGMDEMAPYINTGVILMNLEALRKIQDFDAVSDFVEKYKRALLLPDQDIITALYGQNIGLLDMMKYNLSDRMLTIYNMDPGHELRGADWARENAVIIHYYGKNKPWRRPYLGVLDVFYHEIHDGPDRYGAGIGEGTKTGTRTEDESGAGTEEKTATVAGPGPEA